MKTYVEGSQFPLFKIGGHEIPKMILGTHPFDGITYTSIHRDQLFRQQWTGARSMVHLLKPIVSRFGVTSVRGFPSPSQYSYWHQKAIRQTMQELDTEIAIVLGTILPLNQSIDIRPYLYRLSLQASKRYASKWRKDAIIQYWLDRNDNPVEAARQFIHQATALPLTPPRAWKNVEIDYHMLDELLHRYKEFNVPIYASNETWNFLVLAQRYDEFQELVTYVRNQIQGPFLLGTHYAGIIIPHVEAAGLNVDGYSTPVNAAGILMFPTQELAVQAIYATSKPVIAIKPLGGGRVPPQIAFSYVFKDVGVHAAMVGIGSLTEAQETLTEAHQLLNHDSP